MITCQDARQLFDRYLDDELSPSLQAELHAHQLRCSACQSELAMFEACGDVILLDRCEPTLSESFTDRVLLAHRGQLARRPRHWGRRLVLVGSPMAAAASIFLAITLIMPSESQKPGTMVASELVGASDKALELRSKLTEDERKDLANVPQMPGGLVEDLLAAGVSQTRETVASVRSGMSELGLLVREALTETNEQLAAEWQPSQPVDTDTDSVQERAVGNDMDLFSPPSLAPEPAGEAVGEVLLDPI